MIICDLDGTLFNDQWRLEHLPKKENPQPSDYETYNELHVHDHVNPNVLTFLYSSGQPLAFATARPEKFRQSTEKRLKSLFGKKPHLLMRPEGDLRTSPEVKLDQCRAICGGDHSKVYCVIDDREDVRVALEKDGFTCYAPTNLPSKKSPDSILSEMAKTYRERNKVYGDNWKRVGDVMTALFPNGITLNSADEFNEWHLFELMIVKLTRFANSNLSHQDSIHDLAVYAAMVESIVSEKKK